MQIHCLLKVATQVDKVVKKTFGMLDIIDQGIADKMWDFLLQLYKTLVGLHLEYCVQF